MSERTAEERVTLWVEAGKAVGKEISNERGGRRFYMTVAIRKQGGRYRATISEIDEKLFAAEVFEREEDQSFDSLKEAIDLIESTTPARFSELAPRKGLKWS